MSEDRYEHMMHWEKAAAKAVEEVLDEAEFDDFRRVIAVPGDDERLNRTFSDVDELRFYLAEIYDNEWYAYVPFDSGEAVFEGDSVGFVSDELADRDIESFFDDLRDPEDSETIIASRELIKDSNHSRIVRIDLETINKELIEYLASHPQRMRDMDPRSFEELVAELFKNMGYDVELTPRSRDGGIDIVAIQRSDLGAALTLIECKRYRTSNRVGVDIVRGLYGVVEQKKATRGIIATTSYFTKDAAVFRDSVPYRMGLADFDTLTGYLRNWQPR